MARAQDCKELAPEVDNTVRSPKIENCLIGPCIDTEGQLRGVVQLINKQTRVITAQDEVEFKVLLTTIAEMIKQVDTIKTFSDVNANMNYSLTMAKDNIDESTQLQEERTFQRIDLAMQRVANRLDTYSKQKQV